MDSTTFNGSFWIAIVASISGFVLVIVGALNKSKCSKFGCCWGLCSITRDTHAEEDIEMAQINHLVVPTS